MSVKALRNQLLAAIAMVLVAALSLGSSTFAWFAMNTTVEAKNMQVRAIAEDGLLINEVAEYDSSTWDEEATANQTASNPVSLYPSSTRDGSTWYHAASKKSNTSASATAETVSTNLINGAYTTLTGLVSVSDMAETAKAGVKAARTVMGARSNAPAGYYVHYTYYLKGASGSAVTLGSGDNDMNVKIAEVTATVPTTSASTALNSSLRVGIQMKKSGNFYIISPKNLYTNATKTYYVAAAEEAKKTTVLDGSQKISTDLGSLPAAGTDGTPVEVYIWYEGEDTNCKSDNATATKLDNIQIDIKFNLETNSTT